MTVQLPKTIRQWFTPEQACEYLSRAFECEVLQKDLDYFSENLPFYIRANEVISGFIPIFKELCDFEPIYRNYLNTEHGRGMVQFKVHSGIFKVRSVEWDRDFCVRCYEIDLSIEKVAFGESIDSQEMKFNTNSLNLNFILHESEEQAIRDEKTEIFNVIIGEIGYPRHELDRFIKAQTEPETTSPQNEEPKGSHLAVIWGLKQMLLTGQDGNGNPIKQANVNQDIIRQALETFEDQHIARTGFGKRTIDDVFSEANRYIENRTK